MNHPHLGTILTCSNPADHEQTGTLYVSLTRRNAMEARSLSIASMEVRRLIELNDLGSSDFVGGDVYDASTNSKVAEISYNGRNWDIDGHEILSLWPFAGGGLHSSHDATSSLFERAQYEPFGLGDHYDPCWVEGQQNKVIEAWNSREFNRRMKEIEAQPEANKSLTIRLTDWPLSLSLYL